MKWKKGEWYYQGFKEGDQVWLEGTNLQLSHLSTKLTSKRYGPFKVLKEISPVIFCLKLPSHWTLHNVFHVSLLMAYWEMMEHRINFHEPPPELIEGKAEYKVEHVLNLRCHRKNKWLQFLIQWKGYSTAYNSWEDAEEVHAPELIEEYFQRKQTAI